MVVMVAAAAAGVVVVHRADGDDLLVVVVLFPYAGGLGASKAHFCWFGVESEMSILDGWLTRQAR